MAINSSILGRESHKQRSLVDYSPWGHKESDMTEVTQQAPHFYAHTLHISNAAEKIHFLAPLNKTLAKLVIQFFQFRVGITHLNSLQDPDIPDYLLRQVA